MARLAEVLVATFRLQIELPRRAGGSTDYEIVREYSDVAQRLPPAFVGTLDALLRRQMVAAAERMWSTDDEKVAVT
jgi:hypothetical protein